MRSAWLANFFTYGDSFCWHEGLNHFESTENLFNAMERRSENSVGDASSGLPLYADEAYRRFPEARWVVIHRESSDAILSYRNYFERNQDDRIPTDPDMVAKLFLDCEMALTRMNSLPITRLDLKYSELEHEYAHVQMWNFLLPGVKFPRDRYTMLQAIRMNMIPAKIPKLKGEFAWAS